MGATNRTINSQFMGCRAESGLTLIEVIFAVILLAGTMITLLGLQSSNTARTREDRNKIKAMLAAREILSAIEIQEESLTPGVREGTVEEVFDRLVTKPPREEEAGEAHPGLSVKLEIENFALPDIGETALQKMVLTVYWGDAAFESFKTTYFTPGRLLSSVSKETDE